MRLPLIIFQIWMWGVPICYIVAEGSTRSNGYGGSVYSNCNRLAGCIVCAPRTIIPFGKPAGPVSQRPKKTFHERVHIL